MAVQSDCGFSLSYNLTVSDNDSLMTTDTNARVPVDGSDNYTVTIFASNGCPGLAEEIGEWMGPLLLHYNPFSVSDQHHLSIINCHTRW